MYVCIFFFRVGVKAIIVWPIHRMYGLNHESILCILVTKKPAGTVDEIEQYFGCSASQLIMV